VVEDKAVNEQLPRGATDATHGFISWINARWTQRATVIEQKQIQKTLMMLI